MKFVYRKVLFVFFGITFEVQMSVQIYLEDVQ